MSDATEKQLADLISGYTDLKKYFESVRGEIDKRLSDLAEIIDGKRAIPQEEWKTPELQSGWLPYGGEHNAPAYFKDSLGMVHIRGLVKSGTDSLIFTLPQGYLPVKKELHATCTHPCNISRIDVRANGEVIRVSGDPGWLSLDGITFRAK